MDRTYTALVVLVVFTALVTPGRAGTIEAVHGFEPRFVMPPSAGMVNIRDLGAVGDGKTDDTAAFLKAFSKDEPRAIYVPAGTYLIREQLRYGINDGKKKKVTLIGESRSSTILRLADNSPGFDDPSKPKAFIHTRHPKQQGEQNMHNFIMHLTLEIGKGNPGAIGLEFHTNNTGAVKDVTIRAVDPVAGRGLTGLSCSEWEVGPASVRYVTVEGFQTGFGLSKIANYVTLEHVTARQCETGIDSETASIRRLTTEACDVGMTAHGQLVLIDSNLSGKGAAAIRLADKASLLARNVVTSGFANAVAASGNRPAIAGARIDELVIGKSVATDAASAATLNLPIQESPELQYPQSADQWAVMPRGDISSAMQDAIDRGVNTIFIPGGGGTQITQTIRVRNTLQRIMGVGNAQITFKTGDEPGLILEDGSSDMVFCELIYGQYGSKDVVRWRHDSRRTLVYRYGEGSYDSTERARGAKVFIENIVGHPFHFTGVNAWVRDIDTEMGGPDQTNIINRDGNLWVLGHKTEDFATKIATIGGSTELLGGTYRQNWDDEDFQRAGIRKDERPPLFFVQDGRASFTYISWGPAHPFDVLVRSVQGATVKQIKRSEHGGGATLATVGEVDK